MAMAIFLAHLFLFLISLFSANASIPPPTPLIEQACRATRYPELCYASLADCPLAPEPPADTFVLAAIDVSANNLQNAQSDAQSILDSSADNPNRTVAAKNCINVLNYSAHRLDTAREAFTNERLADARAMASAALLYQTACLGGLKYVNNTEQVADAMSFLVTVINTTSNALSMMTAFQRYGANTSEWAPPQTERDGYWGPSPDGGKGLGSEIGVPTDLVANITVCKGDDCEYRTVQSAVDAAPDYGTSLFVIYIKKGVYEEIVRVPLEKSKVVFLGDGMGKTVITGNLSANMVGVSTYNTATVGVVGDFFMASNLTISNTAGPESYQAVAFRSDGDFSILESVDFVGHQDTLYVHALRQLYKSCRISGTVDFIFGNAAAVFENCLILIVPRQLNPESGGTNVVSAHGRSDPAQSTGFVFHNCVINGSADYYNYYSQNPQAHRSYLGRPWKEYSRTVYIRCYLDEIVRPEGWMPWTGDFALSTLFYGEYGNKGPGSNMSGRVPWSTNIPKEHLAVYSVQNFIQLR